MADLPSMCFTFDRLYATCTLHISCRGPMQNLCSMLVALRQQHGLHAEAQFQMHYARLKYQAAEYCKHHIPVKTAALIVFNSVQWHARDVASMSNVREWTQWKYHDKSFDHGL